MPELVVINKADSADPIELEGLQLTERQSVVVSAVTGQGIDALQAEIERLLPRQFREVRVVLPYDRGDLLSRLMMRARSSRSSMAGAAPN